MKNSLQIILIIFITINLSSCYAPKYLPKAASIYQNEYGAFIKYRTIDNNTFAGEIIAVDSSNLIILNDYSKELMTYPINKIKRFRLRYALPKHYEAFIPIFILYPAIHGYYSLITMPFHVLITTLVSVSGENDFRYTSRKISYQQLRMFARFPQGIPANITSYDLN